METKLQKRMKKIYKRMEAKMEAVFKTDRRKYGLGIDDDILGSRLCPLCPPPPSLPIR